MLCCTVRLGLCLALAQQAGKGSRGGVAELLHSQLELQSNADEG